MHLLLRKLKPTSGVSHFLHQALLLVLPVVGVVLVRLNFSAPALIVIVLSKWRMFAVRPRFWAANVRANAIDMMVGLSTVILMAHTDSESLQLIAALAYAAWLLLLKPRSTLLYTTAQAFI